MVRKLLPLIALCLFSLLLVASGPVGSYGFPLSHVSNDPGEDEMVPALAFNTSFMQTYAAVWQHNTGGPVTIIYARQTNSNGQLNGITVPISPTSGLNSDPDIVYNRDTDQFLVVYERDHAGIYGIILNNTLSTVIPEFVIAEGAGSYSTPAVAYSRGSGRYLVTWMASGAGFQGIQARAVTSAGTVGTSLLDVTGLVASDPAYPDVAWSAPLNHFLVVWQKTATPFTDKDVYGQIVGLTSLPPTPDPVAIGPNFSIFTNTEDELYPAVAAVTKAGGTGQFLVTTEAYWSGAPLIDGQLVTDGGSLEGARLFISDGSGYRPAVAGNNNNRSYLVAWNDSTAAVSACNVYPDGNLDPISTFTSVNGASNAAVTAGPSGYYMIAADGWINAGYPRDVYGYLWAKWVYLPLVRK